MKKQQQPTVLPPTCRFGCAASHATEACPQIKKISYDADGHIISVERFSPADYVVMPTTTTAPSITTPPHPSPTVVLPYRWTPLGGPYSTIGSPL